MEGFRGIARGRGAGGPWPPLAEEVDFLTGNWGKTGFVKEYSSEYSDSACKVEDTIVSWR